MVELLAKYVEEEFELYLAFEQLCRAYGALSK